MLGLFGLNPEIKLPVREGRSIFFIYLFKQISHFNIYIDTLL